MRELGIEGVSRRRGWVRTTTPDTRCHRRLISSVATSAPAVRTRPGWLTITYVPTHEGWLFLAAVMDLYSRKIVGWSMREDLEAALVIDAISMAVTPGGRSRGRPSQRQGRQYASIAMGAPCATRRSCQHRLQGRPVRQRRRRKLHRNGKNELVRRRVFRTRDQARLAIFRYIETFYDPLRRHSSLGMLSPDEYENRYRKEAATPVAA